LEDSTREKVVRIYARVVAAGVFLLLIAGAAVTSTESGLAVPDWPLSYGRLMPPMVGGIFYEHGHRIVAAAVSTLVGIQVAVLLLFEKRKGVKLLGLIAFGAILAQAVLGGMTVIFLLPPAVSSAHAGLAEVVFALTAAIALLTSRWYQSLSGKESGLGGAGVLRIRRLLVIATAAVYVQILVGAVMRHTGAGLAIPDFPLSFGRLLPLAEAFRTRGVPIHFAHRFGALAVAVLILMAARALFSLRRVDRRFAFLASLWTALLVAQVALGGLSVWTKKAPTITVAHLAVGALCWVAGVLAVVSVSRLTHHETSAPSPSSPNLVPRVATA